MEFRHSPSSVLPLELTKTAYLHRLRERQPRGNPLLYVHHTMSVVLEKKFALQLVRGAGSVVDQEKLCFPVLLLEL